MRRARLMQVLSGIRPVDAMNPNPNTEELDGGYLGYYRSSEWHRERGTSPYYIPPAIHEMSKWPRTFHGQQYRVRDDPLDINPPTLPHPYVTLRLDLNRRGQVIKREFEVLLADLRSQHPEPERINPRLSAWADMQLLQVWDLRQFKVSWTSVAQQLRGTRDRSAMETVRNANKTAQSFIDNGRWVELALYDAPSDGE